MVVSGLAFWAGNVVHGQDCPLTLPDTLEACPGEGVSLDWEAWGLADSVWVGVVWSNVDDEGDSLGLDQGLVLEGAGWWGLEFHGSDGAVCLDSIFIDELPSPMASFNANDGGCANDGVAFANTTTGGVGVVYSWDFGDGGIGSTFTSPTHFYDAALPADDGTYEVTLTATNGDGSCPSTVTQTIQVLPIPVPNFLDAPPLCQTDADWPNYTLFLPPYPFATSWHLDWGNGSDTTFSAPSFTNQPGTVYDTFGIFDITLTTPLPQALM